MNLKIDPEWLLCMAEKEGNGIISVGGLVMRIASEECSGKDRAAMTDGPLSEIQACLEDAAEALTDALQLIDARSDAGERMLQALDVKLGAINDALGKAMTAEFRRAVEAEEDRGDQRGSD